MGAYITDREIEQISRNMALIVRRSRTLDTSTRNRIYNAARLTGLALNRGRRRAEKMVRGRHDTGEGAAI